MLSHYHNTVTLSFDDCKRLREDLESKDPARLEDWRLYFEGFAAFKEAGKGTDATFEDLLTAIGLVSIRHAQITFFHLVGALSNKRESEGLSVDALLAFLGQPDESSVTRTAK